MSLHFACFTGFIVILDSFTPKVRVPARLTRLTVSVHSRYFDVSSCRTVQFGRLFSTAYVKLWYSLVEPSFPGA